MAYIRGNFWDDELFGSDDDDAIDGFDGNDNIFGGGGNDALWGGRGNDALFGDWGDDRLTGSLGADYLAGGPGNDTAEYWDSSRSGVIVNLLTGWGYGGTAEGDRLYGVENISGSNFDDVLIGDDGANTLTGDGRYVLEGGSDTLLGGGGADRLLGGLGNDFLQGGTGADRLDGGDGDDTADYSTSSAGVFVELNYGYGAEGDAEGDTLIGIENLNGSAYGDSLLGTDGANRLSGYGGADALRGYGGIDYLSGGDGNDYLAGDDEDDTLLGGAGDDWLIGGAGADEMEGGRGNDTYWVDNPRDLVSESGGSDGTDWVNASISFNLSSSNAIGIENLTLTGIANTSGIGNARSNLIVGNSGDNVLNGGGGGDTLRGLSGNDTYVVDNALDLIDEAYAGSSGVDRVISFVTFNLANVFWVRGSVENLVLSGTGNLNGTGNALANVIIGNNGVNFLDGAAGNDVLTGGAGNDVFVFDSALNSATNVDRIGDFSAPSDTIGLENAIFLALAAPGTLTAAAFYAGATAHDASDRIVYNSATGFLNYDRDGTGAAAAVHFATLSPGLAITNTDFLVI